MTLSAIVEDADTWIGITLGALAVAIPLCILLKLGRVRWVNRPSFQSVHSNTFIRHRSSSFRQTLSRLSHDETWYDALEDFLPATAEVVDYASRAVPLLLDHSHQELDGHGAGPNGARRLNQLLGRSLPKSLPDLPPVSRCWSPGDASKVKVRVGPNYLSNGYKDMSLPALYECVGVDVVSAACRIDEAIPRLGPIPAGAESWSSTSRVPRALVVNCQLPFQEGPKLFGQHPPEDAGVSVIIHFVATPDLLKLATGQGEASDDRLPAVRILQDLMDRKTLDLPNGEKPGNSSVGVMKAIGQVEDLAQVDLPRYLRSSVERYNGKPILLSGCCKMFPSENGEFAEVDFDVRTFSWPTKSALCKLRDRMRSVTAHMAFVLQGTADEDLPEVVLADVRLHNVDLDQGAWIDDPRAPAPTKQGP
mmetsp:Transcript_60803/g.133051  ORF Transcript_60803/g.133051 Transcript_60803/m.133051 type:complete len:420 (-) Transcript_60803:198-1457(-)|eukprot:CAMPEP_0206438112 /NCGR_PEP_ID=MMETSP0324_2-20121206/11427_1 /ASSEMBLY_ACC=CAM_ASM_000836 /TAXON_ID=2866 /ORGANISM="Crypthecodinium cohnii, Strain Seligo" /LENGTH=419 /DNA_ID=CAMNT_0053905491 /DNA_START=4 /DNA_END=1263 /DNA_ORIENTATION=+